jgi:hypothetical protein
MKTIIFSKDRPAQLHLLLESIQRNDPNHLYDPIEVIYTASNADFRRGYVVVAGRFRNVTFVHESNFRLQTIDAVSTAGEFVVFMVDDMILYRKIEFAEKAIQELFEGFPLACFSMRLGRNTTHMYQYGIETPLPKFISKVGEFLVWHRHAQATVENFSYVGSVDAHIFRTPLIEEILRNCTFNNPNELEVSLVRASSAFPPIMACCEQSLMVNSPINRVQDAFKNRFGVVYFMSAEGLNEQYLRGRLLDLDSIRFDEIAGCHQELDVKFR